MQSYQKESTTKKYIYICICYTWWRLFSSMMYGLYETDTPYEWVLKLIYTSISVSANFHLSAQLYFQKIMIQAFILIIFGEKFFFFSIKILKLHLLFLRCITYYIESIGRMQRIHPFQKNIRLKKNVKP